MKNLFMFFLLGTLITSVSVKAQESDKDLCQRKIISFTKMKHTGTVLEIGGAALTIVGIVVAANSSWETQSDFNGNQTVQGDAAAGILLAGIGVDALIGGIVLHVIGAKKVREYTQKLNGLSLKINCNSQQKGILLTYRF
jgi:hypothetical protein